MSIPLHLLPFTFKPLHAIIFSSLNLLKNFMGQHSVTALGDD